MSAKALVQALLLSDGCVEISTGHGLFMPVMNKQ